MGNQASHEDISPAEYDILWAGSDLERGNDIMTTGQENGTEEKMTRRNTVSLAKGEHFSSDVVLVFSGRRRSTGGCDTELQEALRTRLRLMESSSQDISCLFKDLSARLLSVHAERDCFILTFKTVEEIWRFSTYLSLGYVARCLENFLCDPSFWLDPALLSDVEICVSLQEEHLATLYLGLLLQEGAFFAKAVRSVQRDEDDDDEERLECVCDALLCVRDVGKEELWEGTLLATGARGLIPANACQPLPYPFYQ
ncbi:SH3 domain and tetratricopeptide repeat-containing protein 2-like isoform X2 [Engraulis encrasicolus]|uniref:SH3 domain and tetratricopeptide repeat-containing protein 2-like isoform X2 n=1 Tax=Engraulis encrasicolus TaxID=184585 RepID=UPI002FD326AE